jgi:hypothetical protein
MLDLLYSTVLLHCSQKTKVVHNIDKKSQDECESNLLHKIMEKVAFNQTFQ